jgi:hypothetical protein
MRLGFSPRRLSVGDGHLYVSGLGGVVRWDDGFIMLRRDVQDSPAQSEIGRVAMSNEGLVVCEGRRIYRLSDGRYVGSASDLVSAEGSTAPPDGALVFTRQAEAGALVGLMTPDLREIDVDRTTVPVPGIVRSVRVFDGKIWIVTDEEILSYRVMRETDDSPSGLRLVSVNDIDVIGARDVARVDDDHLAIIGSFGRALYRLRSTGARAGRHIHLCPPGTRPPGTGTDRRPPHSGGRPGGVMAVQSR